MAASTGTKETSAMLVESSSPTRNVDDENKQTKKRNMIIIASIIFIIIVAAVVLIVVLVVDNDEDSSSPLQSNEFYEEQFLEIPSNDSCYQYSVQFASAPHVAGMDQTGDLGRMFGEIMNDLGYEAFYDDIHNAVLDHYNSSSLSINNRTVELGQEAIPGQNETFTSFRNRAWIAYSASGHHTAPLLYVNEGDDEDYDNLIQVYGVDLNNSGVGYIGLAKRGSRPAQAYWAGRYGLKGLILFEDFYEEDASLRYPFTAEMPNFGHRTDGRIRWSPGCTGNPDATRLREQCGFNSSEYYDDLFPAIKYNISMIQISPNTAIEIFNRMHNESDIACAVSVDLPGWNTSLPVDVCLGATNEVMAELVTSNEIHYNDTITNVYGYYEGEQYPDEIVMIGAHRDAWAMGACDDISGTVTVLEIARSLSVLRDDYGWRPKRSLMFGSWDGEEWGLYGSVAFNEQENEWKHRVVAYLNFDMTVVGGKLSIAGNPMFRQLLLDTAQRIAYPYPDSSQSNLPGNSTNFTLYDTWYDPGNGSSNNLVVTACNTDFCAFEYYSGIPTLGAGFYSNAVAYTYHTFYDLNGWLDVVDPKWKFAQSIAMYGGLLMLQIAQQDLLPFDVGRLAVKLEEWATVDLVQHIEEEESSGNCTFDEVLENGLNALEDGVTQFVSDAAEFKDVYESTLNGTLSGETLTENIESINRILKELMKVFSLKYPQGTPASVWYKQLLFRNGATRYPYIWDVVNEGCNGNDTSALQEAFDITVGAISNASALLSTL